MREFVAVDGEAIGQGSDTRYALLAASTGRYVWSDQGVSTERALNFLCELQTDHNEIVAFGLSYDINQWLIDLSKPELTELWKTGDVMHRHWRLQWLRGRRLFIKDLRRKGRFAYVQETFGFFQSSFVKACKAWGVDVGDSMPLMKLQRGEFTADQQREVIDYCLSECRALVDLMSQLRDAADTAGCVPTTHMWIGAGQLASQLLSAQGVKDHHQPDQGLMTDRGYDALLTAYFGGRAELLRQGDATPLHTYDLRSAYPWGATLLGSLNTAKVHRRRRYDPIAQHAIWRCRWENLPGQVMPFPVRVSKVIYYPRTGSGWYHACEVAAAIAAGYPITITDGYVLTPGQGAPFDWVPTLFAQRRKWQQEGHPAEKALKLALNSLYGKTAQGFGNDPDRPPKWQSYWWAGEMTARTRARMLALAVKAKDPMMIATDGLFAARAPARPGEQIGMWEVGQLDSFFAAQAGVYRGVKADGSEMLKSRGFFVNDIDYNELRAGWLAEGPSFTYQYSSRRFIGLGQALQRSDFSLWRQWIDAPRAINLMPQRKLLRRDHRTSGWLCLPWPAAPGDSEPYVPKGALLDTDDDDNVAAMEQPLRDSI